MIINPFSLPSPSDIKKSQNTQPNYGQLGGQLAAQAVQYIPQQTNPYMEDSASFLRGAGQGAQAGAAFGAPGMIAGGIGGAVAGPIMNNYRVGKEIDNINTTVNGGGLDMYGAPQYNSSAFERARQELDALNAAQRKSGKSLSFSPRNAMKRQDKIEQLQANLESAQDRYNTGSIDYDKKQLAMAQYNDQQRNDYNFPYNLI